MLIFTMIPSLSVAVYAEDGGASPAISIGAGNIEKGNKVYMGVRLLGTGPFTESPISWIVLGDTNSTNLMNGSSTFDADNARLLITEKTQGGVPFDPDGQNNVWQGSNIQRWCDEFITGDDWGWNPETETNQRRDHFTGLERAVMLSTSKTDSEYDEWGASSLENEKLFLLSAEEVSDDYGYFNGNDSRIAYQHDKNETWDWWLRSPGRRHSDTAARVTPSGSVGDLGVRYGIGARPAFNLNLSSVLFTSAAVGGKSSGAVGANALSAIPDNTTNEWKMTLHDSGRDGFAAAAATGAVLSQDEGYTSWSIPVVYSGASAGGDNDYVSVILADSSDKVLYYGNIANKKASSSDEGQEVTIPSGLTVGDYKLYVFSEQINGDKLSDYASALKTINLKVNAYPPKAITPTVTLSAKAYTYNGKVKKPTVTVKDGSTKLAASQYDVTYASGRKNVGTYKVTVKMKGNYSGSKTVSFKINPKGTTLSKVTKAKKAATVKWKKQAAKMSTSRITGYQIQLATDSKFTKGKKTVNVKGYKKVSRKVTKLKGGKTYYVKIRTYKTIKGKKYYSKWSKVKTVKTKK